MKKTNLIFLDTETTGTGPKDRLCQVAYKFNEEEFESLFKPPLPIEVGAMAVSHITNRMVEDKDVFLGSVMHKHLEELFAADNILVAHNAPFDAVMLKKENLDIKNIIDTFKIAQHLDAEGDVPRYALQYLRYFYDLDVADAPAHNALGDIRVLEKLFNYYFDKMHAEIGDEEKVLREMLEISAKPVLIKRFNFGKYIGQKVKDVAQENRGYLEWLFNEKVMARERGEENDEDWIYTLDHYLQK